MTDPAPALAIEGVSWAYTRARPTLDAVSLEDLERGDLPESASRTAAGALSWLPVRCLSESEVAGVEHGRPVADGFNAADPDLPVAMVAGDRLVAVGRRESELLHPDKVFHDG